MNGREVLSPDFCVIGAGAGGLSFAAGALQMGASVVIVENKWMGGDCLNAGCVPSKALIAAAKSVHTARESQKFGFTFQNAKLDFSAVYNHIHKVIGDISYNDSVERFTKLGGTVVLDSGQFASDKEFVTQQYVIRPRKFIIATGSSPFTPPIPGLDKVEYLTNETIFNLRQLPEHLVIIGGGPIGIEMAQAFNYLGSKVSVLEAFSVLPRDDQDAVSLLKARLVEQGITLYEKVKINNVAADRIDCTTQDQQSISLSPSHILVATGRRPNVSGLGLEAAQVQYSPKGIVVNGQLRTSNPKIYAIGDCIGSFLFTHVAGYHAGLAIRNSIFKLGTKVETRAVPWVTYTDPELAHVGMLPSQLTEMNIPHKTLKIDFSENDRAHTEDKTLGFINVHVTPKGRVLGATILGPNAGELIYPWVIAIQNNLKLSAIASSLAPYPTYGDISKRISGMFYADKLFSPMMRKVVKLLLRFGR